MARQNAISFLCIMTTIVVIVSSCKNSSDEKLKPLLGSWELAYSEMNNVQNSFMNNGFMDFEKNHKVTTNIFGDKGIYDFTFDGSIVFISGPEDFEMDVQFITPDSIVLDGTIKNFEMKFGLSRK